MVVFGFPDGSRLIWLGGSNVRATGPDPVRRLTLQADALSVIARTGDGDVRAALQAQLRDAVVVMEGSDIARLPSR